MRISKSLLVVAVLVVVVIWMAIPSGNKLPTDIGKSFQAGQYDAQDHKPFKTIGFRESLGSFYTRYEKDSNQWKSIHLAYEAGYEGFVRNK